jgi:hypothetical protein
MHHPWSNQLDILIPCTHKNRRRRRTPTLWTENKRLILKKSVMYQLLVSKRRREAQGIKNIMRLLSLISRRLKTSMKRATFKMSQLKSLERAFKLRE